MRLRRISLRNFRNLREVELSPSPEYNLLLGPNGAGKTNLCEAIYYAARGELLKGERQRELITWGEGWASLELEVDRDLLRIVLDGTTRVKRVEVNGKGISSRGLTVYLRAIAFTADDLQIIKGEPQIRRGFLDGAVAELFPGHRSCWRRYERVVREKNHLLRQGKPDEALLSIYREKMVELGASLISRRLWYLKELNRELALLRDRSGLDLRLGRPLRLEYLPSFSLLELPEEPEELKKWLAEGLAAISAEERRRGLSLIGPHRDDLRFTCGGIDLRRFGSQGEQRTAIIQVKLAQLELHRRRFGSHPVLILDDLLSELDPRMGRLLLSALPPGVQAFLTATELRPPLTELPARVYRLEGGELKEEA